MSAPAIVRRDPGWHVTGLEQLAEVAASASNRDRHGEVWLAWLRATYPAVTFIAPWITAIESGADDRDQEQRARGLRDDVRVVCRCDGIVLCGGRVSSGMRHEAKHAANVIDLTALGPEPPR